jgi:hypothetical protein
MSSVGHDSRKSSSEELIHADTLCTPRSPIHEQSVTLDITPGSSDRLGTTKKPSKLESRNLAYPPSLYEPASDLVGLDFGFLKADSSAFKSMSEKYPLYGKHGEPPISPEAWWTELIRRCIKEAGASNAGQLRPSLLCLGLICQNSIVMENKRQKLFWSDSNQITVTSFFQRL